MRCRCDDRLYPPGLEIPPGLPTLPRQLARFDAWLADMRRAARAHPALHDWSTQAPGDLGAMILEFWAYVAEVQSFYDAVRADEAYVQTAPDAQTLERLVALLGYQPRPAVSASAWISVEASGVKPFTLPARSAFRSGPVGEEAPQIFELDHDLPVVPALGALDLDPPPPADLGAALGVPDGPTIAGLWVDPASLSVDLGDLVVVQLRSDPATVAAGRVASLNPQRFEDERDYTLMTFEEPLAIATTTAVDDVSLLRPVLEAGLWTATAVPEDADAVAADGRSIVLDGLRKQVAPGDPLVVWSPTTLEVALVESARDETMTVIEASAATTEDEDGDDVTIQVPAARGPSTLVELDRALTVSGGVAATRVGFGMSRAAALSTPPPQGFSAGPNADLTVSKAHRVRSRLRDRSALDTTLLLVDLFGEGSVVSARVDPAAGTLTLGQEAQEIDLALPVSAYANASLASRGESVLDEEIGFGDASQPHQALPLSKTPLTYLAAPTESGVTSTLTVRVDGVEWTEVPTLFGHGPTERVFVVRHGEDDSVSVVFGDGEVGPRLPTGARVTADYRHGAGAASPEGDSITQMVSPMDAVTAVHQPFAAFGGADAEDAEELRTSAPESALLLGRAISLADLEVAARGQPGVAAAKAEYGWAQDRQGPMARIWFAGDEQLAGELKARLRALCDRSTAIDTRPAQPLAIELSIQITVEEGYRSEDVLTAVRASMTQDPLARLAFPSPRIGAPLLRTVLVAEALCIPGAWSVDQMLLDGEAMRALGEPCPPGWWFTVDPDLGGALLLNGESV